MNSSLTRRVLLIEDDEQVRSALQQFLIEDGFDVRTARDGREGMDLVRSFQPDVIVLDLVLPNLNGFDTAAILKAGDDTAEIPLIAVTASWLGSEGTRLQQIGFVSALRKPFPASALGAELRRVLARNLVKH